MGATMANGGVCPTNQDKIFNSETIRNTLSLMYSCGMYNYSGEFAFEVRPPKLSRLPNVRRFFT